MTRIGEMPMTPKRLLRDEALAAVDRKLHDENQARTDQPSTAVLRSMRSRHFF
jgi:hypothetical protein